MTRFGNTWDKLDQPMVTVVCAIDGDGYNVELNMVGLSAMQLRNLDIGRKSGPLNASTLRREMAQNARGLLTDSDYGEKT